jgi:D-lactate dehydrogenase
MKIAIFNTKYYEREYLDKYNVDGSINSLIFEAPLNAATVAIVKTFNAVCIN